MLCSKKNAIKICIISHFGYPLYNSKCKKPFGGGAAVQLYLLSKELAKNDLFDVNIITGKYGVSKNRIETYQKIKLFNVLPIRRAILNYFKTFINFFLYLIIINPDVVIQRLAGITTGFCAFYCKLFQKKFVFSIGLKSDVNGRSERGLFGKFYRYSLNNADYIVAQNFDQIDDLQNNHKKKFKNVEVIRSGYEIKDPDMNVKKYILWVGRAINWKRPEIFIKLAEKFPEENFIMICYREKEDKDYWHSIKIKASNLANMQFTGLVPFNKIDQYFKKSKVLINTSLRNEGFPNTFIQAFKNRSPVISLSVNPDDILTKNKIGFFCNSNFKNMEENLGRLLKENELYKAYCLNSYLYVKRNHNIENIRKEWFDLIKSACSKK